MKNLSFLLMFIPLFCASAFAQKNVAVLEIERHPDIVSEVSHREAMEITNIIRGEAVRTLPSAQYSVMTSETVMAMGDAVLADCAEENCIITIGRRIDAEYIVRGTLSKFQTMFTLHVAMFETEYGNMIATSAPIRSENLIDIINKSAAACNEMYNKFLVTEGHTPAPTYTLTINTIPHTGGTVYRIPDETRYDAGTSVAVAATPADGYRFNHFTIGRSRKYLPVRMIGDSIVTTVTMNRDIMLTARFSESSSAARSSPLKLTMRISTAALAIGGVIGGIAVDGAVKSEHDRYKMTRNPQEAEELRKNTESLATTRNLLYILGGVGAAGFAITLTF